MKDPEPPDNQTGRTRSWPDMGPRDFDAEAGGEADWQQNAMFPVPDGFGTSDLLLDL